MVTKKKVDLAEVGDAAFVEKLSYREIADDCACIVFKSCGEKVICAVLSAKGDKDGAQPVTRLATQVLQDASLEGSDDPSPIGALRETLRARGDDHLIGIVTVMCVNKTTPDGDSVFIKMGHINVDDDQWDDFVETLREHFNDMLTEMSEKRKPKPTGMLS
jgi:hypothetical protein